MKTVYYIVNKVFNCKKTNIYIKIYKSSIKIKYNINEKRKKNVSKQLHIYHEQCFNKTRIPTVSTKKKN